MLQALVSSDIAPAPKDPAILHRLHRRASLDPITLWRLSYDLPINDPRVLSMDAHTALQDLLERKYHFSKGASPTPEDVENLPEAIERMREAYDKAEHAAKIAADAQKRRAANRATTKIESITMRITGDP